MKIAEQVDNAIRPLFKDLDVELIEVEYAKRFDGMHLTVYLDKKSGITIEDCQKVSTIIDPVIEKLNPTADASYYLDVSSYGLDKPLKYDWQLDKYYGKKLNVKLYKKVNDLKDFVGELIEYDTDTITFKYNDEPVKLDRKIIATLLPYIEL